MNRALASDTAQNLTLETVREFLYQEARLLDEQRWEEWDALFTEDGEYWMPSAPDQADPVNHISLIYETAMLRAVRIKRFRHPNAFSLQPRPRTVHFVSNVILDGRDPDSGLYQVNSRVLMVQYRRTAQDLFAAACNYHLAQGDSGLRIARKRVDLVNCDAALGNILVYL